MADDDDDDVAFDDGMEPESATGDDGAAGDDDDSYDDGDDDVAATAVSARGGQPALVDTPRTVRRVSEKVRELAREAAAKIKAAGGLEDENEPLEYDELPQEPDPLAAKKPGEQPPAPAPDPAAPPPPKADDPEVLKLREEHATKLKALDEREAQISARELESDLTALGDQYIENGAPAVVTLLKRWLGANVTDDEMRDEVADLVADLSKHVLGAELPETVENRIERRRVKRLVAHNKTLHERNAKQSEQKQSIAQQQQDRVRVGAVLNQEITKPDHSKAYPFLATEPEAGLIIFDLIEAQKAKDGTDLTWNEAAKRANDYLEKQSRAWFDKRRHLLVTSQAAPSPGGQQPQRTQGGQQVRSTAPPQQPPPARAPRQPPPPAPEKPWNAEEHRKQIKAKHRKAFAAGSDPTD